MVESPSNVGTDGRLLKWIAVPPFSFLCRTRGGLIRQCKLLGCRQPRLCAQSPRIVRGSPGTPDVAGWQTDFAGRVHTLSRDGLWAPVPDAHAGLSVRDPVTWRRRTSRPRVDRRRMGFAPQDESLAAPVLVVASGSELELRIACPDLSVGKPYGRSCVRFAVLHCGQVFSHQGQMIAAC